MSRSPSVADEAALAGGLVAFAKLLRAENVEVGTGALQTAAAALGCISADDRSQVYWALRCSLLSRFEDVAAFDAAFAAFWGEEPPGSESRERSAPAPAAQGDGEAGETAARRGEVSAAEGGDDRDQERSGAGWSPHERLREMDFSAYGADELARARRVIESLARTIPVRRSRRARPARRGSRIDPRRTLQGSLRTGGHPIALHWRRRKHVPRKLVFVIDVSGSMEPYARPVTMFLHAARRSSRKVEGFAFGTRLTRLTEALDTKDPETALARVADAVPDWAGGTRIGESLRALRERSGALLAGAVVVIVSDGWERGDPMLLTAEMMRLRRTAHTLIWVNPLAGDPRYEPLAAGMAVAREHVDLFLPGHNLAALESLADVLELLSAIERRRPAAENPLSTRVEPAATLARRRPQVEKYDVRPSRLSDRAVNASRRRDEAREQFHRRGSP